MDATRHAPTFSIIVPTYNSASTLEACLKSICKQSFKNFEVLIIDGLSKDGTLKIAEGINDSRIKIVSEKDNGIYDAMNKGIKISTGKWLLFLGSDDKLIQDEVLEQVHEKINENPKHKVFYGNVKINGSLGWTQSEDLYDGHFTLEKLLSKNLPHQAIFYHKEIFNALGSFNIRYKVCADYDYNLKVASRYQLYYLNETISIFNAGGLSTRIADTAFNDDFNPNIVHYFAKKLYKPYFKRFEFDILLKAKTELKKVNIPTALYLFMIGNFFKAQRKFKLSA